MDLKTHSGTVTVADSVFGVAYNEGLVHQIVTAYLAGARTGLRHRKPDQKSAVVERSPGDRRVLAVHGQEPREALSGRVAG